MTIIATKYRDIPWEDVCKCGTQAGLEEAGGEAVCRAYWELNRGKPVIIVTPATADRGHFACDEPYFRVHGYSAHSVCPHIAEIGD